MHICLFIKCINRGWPKLHERSSGIKFGHKWSEYRVHTLFWTKNSRSFQGHISHFFKDSVQCKKEPYVCLFWFFHNMSKFILKVFLCLLLLGTWESRLDKVSTEIQGLSNTDCNFKRLWRPWIFIFKFKHFQGLPRCVQTLGIAKIAPWT